MITVLRDLSPGSTSRRKTRSWPYVNEHDKRNNSVRHRSVDPPPHRSVGTSPHASPHLALSHALSDPDLSHSEFGMLSHSINQYLQPHDYSESPSLTTKYYDIEDEQHNTPIVYSREPAQMETEVEEFYSGVTPPPAPYSGVTPPSAPLSPSSSPMPRPLSKPASLQLIEQGVNFCPVCRHPASRCYCSSFPTAVPPMFPDLQEARCFEKGHGCQHCAHCRYAHGGRRKSDLLAHKHPHSRKCEPYGCDGCGLPNPEHDPGKKPGDARRVKRLKKWPFQEYVTKSSLLRTLSRDRLSYRPTTCVRCKQN